MSLFSRGVYEMNSDLVRTLANCTECMTSLGEAYQTTDPILTIGTENYSKKPGFRSNNSRHCAYIIYVQHENPVT